jgi:Rieske Fe-S protein
LTLAALIQGCGSSSPTSPSNVPALPTVTGTTVAGGVTVPVGASSPLAAAGSAALVQSGSSVFLVSRSSAASFVALTAICTHEGCTVTGFENQNYVCPCHGSRYNLNGGVVQGPAPAALRQFASDVANDVLTIHT